MSMSELVHVPKAKHTKDSSFHQMNQNYKILRFQFHHIENRNSYRMIIFHNDLASSEIQSNKDRLQFLDFRCIRLPVQVHRP